ncbi:hypothetical protein L2E82_35429 [Cichorium intybus]|uniref:Uncharacterized protein n=1 Tax=Cichorium intybus TaxID=13427 RepID=A0ACB9BNQ8_CICIN|nr:hypothetical protein L2E82_35429 [Cichorium intybus]
MVVIFSNFVIWTSINWEILILIYYRISIDLPFPLFLHQFTKMWYMNDENPSNEGDLWMELTILIMKIKVKVKIFVKWLMRVIHQKMRYSGLHSWVTMVFRWRCDGCSGYSGVMVCTLHYSDEDIMTRPLLLVTASVDKMVLKETITVGLCAIDSLEEQSGLAEAGDYGKRNGISSNCER